MSKGKTNIKKTVEVSTIEVEVKKEEKLNESQVCNVFKITGTLREVVLKKFKGQSMTINNWRKSLTNERINF